MLRILLLLLLAPLSVLARPPQSPADQLIYQFPDHSSVEISTFPAAEPIIHLVHQFPKSTRLENIAVRSNGGLLLTAVTEPCLYYIDLKAPGPLSPKLLYTFPNATALSGIIETTPDVFVVIAGNWSLKFEGIPGSFHAWSVDLNTRNPTVRKITSMPDAHALNGATTLEKSPEIVLISDSALGGVWRLNASTGDHSMPMQNPLFTNFPTEFPLGINGIGTYGGNLYFINSAQGFYGRIPITDDGSADGEVQVLARAQDAASKFDDFAMTWGGNAWIATHPNVLIEITTEGRQRNVTAQDPVSEMSQPTSVAFGRGSKRDEKKLYMTTTGNMNGGGQVFAIDTCLI